jgi:putative tryptophan/tyrosine transport system substrate-binding protein
MQFDQLKRREFITLLGGAAAWPVAARAQPPAMPVVGFLSSVSQAQTRHMVAAFQRGLGETGYVDGRNAAIEYRFVDGQYDRLPALASEMVRRPVSLILAAGPPPCTPAPTR